MLKWGAILVFCAFAVLEVSTLIEVGGWLGTGWTVVWLVGSVLLGVLVARVAGLQTLLRIHRRLKLQELPTQELLDMGLILCGAMLLVLPGFISDTLGVLMLLPPVRWLFRWGFCAAFGHVLPTPYATRVQPGMADDVIEINPEE